MAEQSKENKKKRSAARDEGHSSSSSSTEDPLFFQLLLIQLHLLPLPLLFLLLLLPASYQSPMCYVPRVECLVNNTFVVSPSPSPSFHLVARSSTPLVCPQSASASSAPSSVGQGWQDWGATVHRVVPSLGCSLVELSGLKCELYINKQKQQQQQQPEEKTTTNAKVKCQPSRHYAKCWQPCCKCPCSCLLLAHAVRNTKKRQRDTCSLLPPAAASSCLTPPPALLLLLLPYPHQL